MQGNNFKIRKSHIRSLTFQIKHFLVKDHTKRDNKAHKIRFGFDPPKQFTIQEQL